MRWILRPRSDVQVGQDPEEPRPHVRARRVGAPAPEGSCVRLLHQLFGLLSRADEAARYAVDLVGESERFLLEADTFTRFVAMRRPASPSESAASGSPTGPP